MAHLDIVRLDISKSIEPLVYGEPPLPTSKHSFGRRLFANGKVDRHGVPRLRPQLHHFDIESLDDNDDGAFGDDQNENPESEQHPSEHDAIAETTQSNIEDFNLDVSGDESSSSSSCNDKPMRERPTFRKRIVAIRTTPIKVAPKSQPSYEEVLDSDEEAMRPPEAPVAREAAYGTVDSQHNDGTSRHEDPKGKGKARDTGIGKRKRATNSEEQLSGQNVRSIPHGR